MESRRAQAGPSADEDRVAETAETRAGQAVPGQAEAGELIEGQYHDRLQLRPVLDAVLAALPAVGPVTVQARKTLVSLATPRRTFAVVQATTKSRVDLGLRLEHERPGGRLLAARDLGAATVRIPCPGPTTSTPKPSAGCSAPTPRTRHRPPRGVPPGARHRNLGRSPW